MGRCDMTQAAYDRIVDAIQNKPLRKAARACKETHDRLADHQTTFAPPDYTDGVDALWDELRPHILKLIAFAEAREADGMQAQ